MGLVHGEVANRLLGEQPCARLRHLSGRKKLYWRLAHSCSGKSERLHLPTRISHNGDFRDFATVREKEIQVIPIGAALPSLEFVGNREYARLCPGIDLSGHFLLRGREFRLLQSAANAQDEDVIWLVLKLCGHDPSIIRVNPFEPIGQWSYGSVHILVPVV
jgi:hypothetical protein